MTPLIEQILFLQNVSIFKDLSVEELGRIASITKTENYEEGEILFEGGDTGDHAYIVISGKVEIYRKLNREKEIKIATFKAGDCFGEMSLFDGEPRSASARILEPCVLSIYSKDDLTTVIKRYPSIALRIIEVLSTRFRENTSRQTNLETS